MTIRTYPNSSCLLIHDGVVFQLWFGYTFHSAICPCMSGYCSAPFYSEEMPEGCKEIAHKFRLIDGQYIPRYPILHEPIVQDYFRDLHRIITAWAITRSNQENRSDIITTS